jgi:hypothetical protein
MDKEFLNYPEKIKRGLKGHLEPLALGF